MLGGALAAGMACHTIELRPVLSVWTVLRLWLPRACGTAILGDRLLLICHQYGEVGKTRIVPSRGRSRFVKGRTKLPPKISVPIGIGGRGFRGRNGDFRFIDFSITDRRPGDPRGEQMHKSIIALVGAAGIGVATLAAPAPASADCIGCAIGAGILGGVAAGAIIGGAIANGSRRRLRPATIRLRPRPATVRHRRPGRVWPAAASRGLWPSASGLRRTSSRLLLGTPQRVGRGLRGYQRRTFRFVPTPSFSIAKYQPRVFIGRACEPAGLFL